jgi:hypothetical protein
MKSRNLNFLEPPGPLQACNGTALPYISHDFINTYIMSYRSHIYSVSQDIRLIVQKLITKVMLTQQYRTHIGPVPNDYLLTYLLHGAESFLRS